ncbi:MAG: hypothetical protein AAF391_05700 [Bacteroidota bacterium]
MMKKTQLTLGLMFWLTFLPGCGKDETTALDVIIDPGNDPNFTIVANTDIGFESFNKKVVVFGLDIYAVSRVTDENLLHAANILAQYLDNDEDGTADDQKVLDAMLSNKAFIVMWKRESDLNIDPPSGREGQDLGNDETHPEWHANKSGDFDAALEEVWHIVTHAGYSSAYPNVFGEIAGTTLANAMDKARGGQFTTVPTSYPDDAWYTYDDQTCDYSCMATEYIYWAMTSMLGAQENRFSEISQEWTLNTNAKVESGDPDVYALLTSNNYKLPTVLPDGTYRR